VGHVQLPNRVLLLCSPCASSNQVPCSASRVVPGAHRVVGPSTHRGSGPREVHTTHPTPIPSRSSDRSTANRLTPSAQALKAAAFHTREHTVPRSAPSKARRRASPPSCSWSQRTLLAPALDHPEACMLACCPGRATPSPAPENQRRPSPASAEPHHRRRPDPNSSHHQTRGEPLATFSPLPRPTAPPAST
jgi:hypothetical protein